MLTVKHRSNKIIHEKVQSSCRLKVNGVRITQKMALESDGSP